MKKRTVSHVTLEALENESKRFISLLFAYCEAELSRATRPYPLPDTPVSTALAAAALSAHDGIKAFLAVARIPNE